MLFHIGTAQRKFEPLVSDFSQIGVHSFVSGDGRILLLSAAGITGVRIWNKKKQVKRLGIEEKKEEKE